MIKTEILLDGNDIPEVEFNIQFEKIVGSSFDEWIERPTTQSDGGSEWYEWRDKSFILRGSAYDPPKLFRIVN